jgi:hypothetical protein
MSVDFEKIPEIVWQLFDEILCHDPENRGKTAKCDDRGSALILAANWQPPLLEFDQVPTLTHDGLCAFVWHKEQIRCKKRRGRPPKNEPGNDLKIVAALSVHHKYESGGSVGGSIGVWTPATGRVLALQAGVTPMAVTRFMQNRFGKENGYKGYVACCRARKIGSRIAEWQHDRSEGHSDLRPEEYGRSEDE